MNEYDEFEPGRKRPAERAAVLIVHHADGTAEVDGVPVVVEPGHDVRDAAYLAAVARVAAAGNRRPTRAVRVEPDGTQYPLTLYPGPTVLAATQAQSAASGTARALTLARLVTAVGGCVLFAALTTLLLGANDPRLERTTLDNEVSQVATGRMSTLGARIGASLANGATAVADSGGGGGAEARHSTLLVPPALPRPVEAAPSPPPAARPARTASHAPAEPVPTQGKSPAAPPAHPAPFAVGDATLALVGGQKGDSDLAYVITLSANGTNPITVTYSYSGSKYAGGKSSGGKYSDGKAAGSTRTLVLSGRTQYAVADVIPGQAYCGGTVTMSVTTVPPAANGTVSATAAQGC